MTPQPSAHRIVLAVAACALLLSPSRPAAGQVEFGSKPTPPALEVFEFEGGTLVEYVDAVRRAAAQFGLNDPVNAVFSDDDMARKVVVPPLKLRKVLVETAIELVRGVAKWPVPGEEVQVSMNVLNAEVYMFAFKLRRSAPQRSEDADTEPTHVRVFLLAEMGLIGESRRQTDTLVETALTAIDTALALANEGARDALALRIKYHPDTSLLFVRGTATEIELVEEVLNRVAEGFEAVGEEVGEEAPGAATSSQQASRDLVQELERERRRAGELEQTVARLERALAALEAKLAALEERRDNE